MGQWVLVGVLGVGCACVPAESLSSRCAGLVSDVTSLGVGARVGCGRAVLTLLLLLLMVASLSMARFAMGAGWCAHLHLPLDHQGPT